MAPPAGSDAARHLRWRSLLAVLALAGCNASGDTVLLVRVQLGFRAAENQVVTLRLRVEDEARSASHDFSRSRTLDGGPAPPLTFPTTFTVQLPRKVEGPVRLELRGLDSAGETIARGIQERLGLRVGRLQEVDIRLDCFGACPQDGGAADGPGGDGPSMGLPDGGVEGEATCGNGQLDRGESCDISIAAGHPGACPSTCDDGHACTADRRIGDRCTSECEHVEIRAFVPQDRCCPAGGSASSDVDCSPTCGNGTIEPGETCDTKIPAGQPGSCPALGDCLDRDPCTTDLLLSAETCAAVCVHQPIVAPRPGDSCCAVGATSRSDPDCPVVCGNGVVEVEAGERCDRGIAAPAPGACPTRCDDRNTCTNDVLVGTGCATTCRHDPVDAFVGGDGCCPPGGNRNLDADCPAICGNAVVESGELCDKAIPAGKPGACPTSCEGEPTGCMPRRLEGRADDCSARCATTMVTVCTPGKDGCCPSGCSALEDADCSSTCGNGTVEPYETCDTALAAPAPGACPTACADKDPCTSDQLVSQGTCSARCQFAAITTFTSGDRCCPPGGNASLDSDCPPVCGNQVVEPPKESCDRGIAAGMPGACPTSCPPPVGCNVHVLVGDGTSCTARCVPELVKKCQAGDGCCPEGCHKNNDTDCPAVCGNGVVEPGEACDRAITAGNPGACRATCDDNDSCTADTASGRVEDCTRTCSYDETKACTTGDRCCPAGCTPDNDRDCAPVCGNGVIEKGETCDPPSACPTTCPDDGDPCTADRLAGDPLTCSATCTHVPITTCSGGTPDRCCPTGCSSKQDLDCPATATATITPTLAP